MPTLPQLRGLLLEEAILYLLRASGYRTVSTTDVSTDPTLQMKPQSRTDIEVRGRGSPHQIDAIADYMIAHPFSNPQRLLVEAKFYRDNIEVDVIRNAVGVLKDVSEFYCTANCDYVPAKNRYHYQYAIFSASGFTLRAQQYAYAHDIHLFPLAHSAYMQPLLQNLRSLTPQHFGVHSQSQIRISPSDLRAAIRDQIRTGQSSVFATLLKNVPQAQQKLDEFCEDCRFIDSGLIAMIDRQFPVLLIPDISIEFLIWRKQNRRIPVRIRREQGQWFLETEDERYRLSFDLPLELFRLYADNGHFSKEAASERKEERLGVIQAFYTGSNRMEDALTSVQMITFELDRDWLEQIRRNIANQNIANQRAQE